MPSVERTCLIKKDNEASNSFGSVENFNYKSKVVEDDELKHRPSNDSVYFRSQMDSTPSLG